MSQKTYQLSEIAEILGAKLLGDPRCEIAGMASLNNAQAGTISFLLSPKYKKHLESTKASAVIMADTIGPSLNMNVLLMADPNIGYIKLARLFEKQKQAQVGIHSSVVIGENSSIADSVSIAPNAVIGDGVTIGENTIVGAGSVIGDDCTIGANSQLQANVTLYHDVKLGDRVLIHSGVVLGADGFGLVNEQGAWQKIPQLGGVTIGNDVEIGANTTIDRGAIDDTVVEEGVKLDNLIMIGHNVRIGAHTAIAGMTGIAGSAHIGKHCMIAGKVGISDHVDICDQTILTAGASVLKSVTEPGIYSSGIPIEPRAKWHRSVAHYRRLDDMAARIKRLERVAHDEHED